MKSYEANKDAECIIFLDGVETLSMPLEPFAEESVNTLYVNSTTMRPLVFADLPTTGNSRPPC